MRWFTVVGVVGNARHRLDAEPSDEVYPAAVPASVSRSPTFAARTRSTQPEVAARVRAVVNRIDPEQPVDTFADAGRSAQPGARTAAAVGDVDRPVCRPRVGRHRGRPRRRHGLLGQPAAAGVRSAAGARRGTARPAGARARARVLAGGHRSRHWPGRGACADAAVERAALRRRGLRCRDIRVGVVGPRRRRCRRVPAAGTPRCTCGSAACVARVSSHDAANDFTQATPCPPWSSRAPTLSLPRSSASTRRRRGVDVGRRSNAVVWTDRVGRLGGCARGGSTSAAQLTAGAACAPERVRALGPGGRLAGPRGTRPRARRTSIPSSPDHAQRLRRVSTDGHFPEGTMLALEIAEPGSSVLPARAVCSPMRVEALEVAVKDRDASPNGWAYYSFGDGTRRAPLAVPGRRVLHLPPRACGNRQRLHAVLSAPAEGRAGRRVRREAPRAGAARPDGASREPRAEKGLRP